MLYVILIEIFKEIIMKIGILTFIHTRNFGANLQCFALQHTLESLGYDAEVINLYRPVDKGYVPCDNDKIRFGGIYRYHSLKDYRSKINKLIVPLINRILGRHKKNNENLDGFLSFQEEFIHFSSEEYRNFTQLYTEFPQNKYSHLITGSDQVWNYSTSFSKEPFFLTFSNSSKTLKISYAASLGHSNLPNEVQKKYKEWLNDFVAISVREESAVAAITPLTDKKVFRVLDPTLLIEKKEWLRSLSINTTESEGYVLVYMLSLSEHVISFARSVAKTLKCSVKIITSRPYFKSFDDCEFLRSENPRSFVELYSKALFVVTNSFHGTAFAINFNVPFVTIDKKESRLNSRKQCLLELFKLGNRYALEDESLSSDYYINCDFSEANRILEIERNKSVLFLKETLRNEG